MACGLLADMLTSCWSEGTETSRCGDGGGSSGDTGGGKANEEGNLGDVGSPHGNNSGIPLGDATVPVTAARDSDGESDM